MSDDGVFTDFSTVRDLLLDAQERRGFLTYEQKAALQHAEWAASDNRNGIKTDPKIFTDMFTQIMEIEIFQKYPELAAKLAELMPNMLMMLERLLLADVSLLMLETLRQFLMS